MTRPSINPDQLVIPLPDAGTFTNRCHVFGSSDIAAINAALAARRPLLIRGEPGTGKTQLAEAAAAALGWPMVSQTVDARTEARDLLYEVDFVLRLAEAQLRGAVPAADVETIRKELGLQNFTRPGPLWWGLDWNGADRLPLKTEQQPPGCWTPGSGCVVLIDEIDKAEADVPNGLLEALGQGWFRDPLGNRISATGATPLIVITTNEERELPDAFLRRCFAHWLLLPEDKAAFVKRLAYCGGQHFDQLGKSLLEHVAGKLFDERQLSGADGQARPGMAEYTDILRVLDERGTNDDDRQAKFDEVVGYVFEKFRPAPTSEAHRPPATDGAD